MTTGKLLELVYKTWPQPAYAVLTEVPDGTASNKSRTADVLAMSLWPSRGLSLIGAELKVSRSDWLKELRSPEKAEAFVKNCHNWFLITAPGVVLDASEIPQTWGWMEAEGNRLKVRIAAPRLEPVAVNMVFLASIFRRISGGLPSDVVARSELDQKINEGLAALIEAHEQGRKWLNDRLEKDAEEGRLITRLFDRFIKEAGLCSWRGEDREKNLLTVAKAVALMRTHGQEHLRTLAKLKERFADSIPELEEGLKALAVLSQEED